MNEEKLKSLLNGVIRYCLQFGDTQQLNVQHPDLFLVLHACRNLQLLLDDRVGGAVKIASGIRYMNSLECDEVKSLKNALQKYGFKNEKGDHRDILSLAKSYAEIPQDDEITVEDRIILATQNISHALDLFINHKGLAKNNIGAKTILYIASKYSIFRDYLNRNYAKELFANERDILNGISTPEDLFNSTMLFGEMVELLHQVSLEHVSHIRPPVDEPPAPAAPAMLTAYNNQQSSSSSSSSSLSNNNNDYSEQVSSVAGLRK